MHDKKRNFRDSATVRVGDISFLNCAPIRWGLAESGADIDISLISAPPEQLAAELLSGGLDISPISVVRYLQNTEDLLLFPGLAIGSDGPVHSCQIVARGSLSSLHGRIVALSQASRTTTILAKMILEDVVGIQPLYRPQRQNTSVIPEVASGAVIIGDDALLLSASTPEGLTLYDTGALWREWTGLPMVFAVWAVRRKFAHDNPEQVRRVHHALLDAVQRARMKPVAVAAVAARESEGKGIGSLEEEMLLKYYRALDFSFGERQLMAIRAFSRRAAAHGEIPGGAQPIFVQGLTGTSSQGHGGHA